MPVLSGRNGSKGRSGECHQIRSAPGSWAGSKGQPGSSFLQLGLADHAPRTFEGLAKKVCLALDARAKSMLIGDDSRQTQLRTLDSRINAVAESCITSEVDSMPVNGRPVLLIRRKTPSHKSDFSGDGHTDRRSRSWYEQDDRRADRSRRDSRSYPPSTSPATTPMEPSVAACGPPAFCGCRSRRSQFRGGERQR